MVYPNLHRILISSFVFVALVILCPMGQAQPTGEVPFGGNALSAKVAVGEFGQLIYKLRGGDGPMPQTIEVEGLEVAHSGEHIVVVNSRIEVTHHYRFRGDVPGDYLIPPIKTTIRGEEFESQPIPVTLYERSGKEEDATRPIFARLELEQTEFYVNEKIPSYLSAYVRGRNTLEGLTPPSFEHENFVIRISPNIASFGEDLGNSFYSVAKRSTPLFALKPGQFRLGPATVGTRIIDSRSPFGGLSIFNQVVYRELATNTVTVTVKPLPTPIPDSFTGGVGRFTLDVMTSATEASVGDPISLTFNVSGVGNLQTLNAPVMIGDSSASWKTHAPSKKLEDEDDSDGIQEGTATFSQVLLPTAVVSEIPAFELAYFDPSSQRYETLQTSPIPIQIREDSVGESVRAIDFSSSPSSEGAMISPTKPNPNFDDILYIRTGSPRWITSTTSFRPGVSFYLVQAVFSIAFFTLIGFGVTRWWRRREALLEDDEAELPFRLAVKRIPNHGASRRDYYHAVSAALRAWQREHPNSTSAVTDVIERVLRQCETFLYSGRTPNDAPISPAETAEFESILQKLPRK